MHSIKEENDTRKSKGHNAKEYMREWKRKAYEENPSKILTKNKAYYIKYKYNLTGDEMKTYGDNLPLVMKIKKGLEELSKIDIVLMTNILAEYVDISNKN
jgi:hypothetical protein